LTYVLQPVYLLSIKKRYQEYREEEYMTKDSKAMVSRSLRLKKETLEILKEQADYQELGITVYIRKVLESLVDNLNNQREMEKRIEEADSYESRTI